MPQRDVLLRWLEQARLVIDRLLHGPGPADFALAEHYLEEVQAREFGHILPLLNGLDAMSAAALLGSPERIQAYAELLMLQATVETARESPHAAVTRERAEELLRLGAEG